MPKLNNLKFATQVVSQFFTIFTKVQQLAGQLVESQVVALLDIYKSPASCWIFCKPLIKSHNCSTICGTVEQKCRHCLQNYNSYTISDLCAFKGSLTQILPSLMAELFGSTIFYLACTKVAQAVRQFAHLFFSRLQFKQALLAQLHWWNTRLIRISPLSNSADAVGRNRTCWRIDSMISTQKHLIVGLLLLLCLSTTIQASDSWYDQKLEGWYYFQDQKPTQDEKTIPDTLEEADNYLATESHKLKQLLSFAIVSPTHENVEKYIRAQRRWMEQSGRFAQMWGKVLLEHPDLSDLLTTPTSSFGVLTKRENDLNRRKELLKTFSNDYFLLFFFKGADRYSQKASEVAQLFASTNNWKLKAVSLDNLGTSELHNFEVDKGISEHFNVQITPSFYIVNPTENQVYPVGVGMISVSEIEENIETQLKGIRDE